MEKFKVGDYVEALVSHCQLDYKKGDRFPVLGVRNITCKSCGKIIYSIDIGVPIKSGNNFVEMVHSCNNPCNRLLGVFTEPWYSATNFKLCATFNKASDDRKYPATYGGKGGVMVEPSYPYPGVEGDSWKHPEGYYCFDRTIDPERYPPYPKPL